MKWKIVFSLWFLMLSAVMLFMHSWHQFEFPVANKAQVKRYLSLEGNLSTLHFLGEGCSCSIHIIDHLLKRKARPEMNETVYLIGKFLKESHLLKQAGFKVKEISREQAQKDGSFSAVPLLVFYNSSKEIQYMGGYAKGSITPLSEFMVLKIAQQIQSESSVEKLPLKGCAISKKFTTLLDPFGLKYGRVTNE